MAVEPPPWSPPPRAVRTLLFTAVAVFGIAALLYVGRYVLLIINRDVLLNSIVAWLGTWVPVAVSALAVLAVIACALMLTEWLIARRAVVFGQRFDDGDPRRRWAMRVGCLLPLANLAWPLTYLVELAKAEGKHDRLQRPIWTWGTAFLLSTVVSVYSFVMRFFAHDTQAIADNTLAFVVANLIAMATGVVTMRLVSAFESAPPVDRPAHRWLVVADEKQSRAEKAAEVEPEGQEPAA